MINSMMNQKRGLTNTHEPIQEITMVFLISERPTTIFVETTFQQYTLKGTCNISFGWLISHVRPTQQLTDYGCFFRNNGEAQQRIESTDPGFKVEQFARYTTEASINKKVQRNVFYLQPFAVQFTWLQIAPTANGHAIV